MTVFFLFCFFENLNTANLNYRTGYSFFCACKQLVFITYLVFTIYAKFNAPSDFNPVILFRSYWPVEIQTKPPVKRNLLILLQGQDEEIDQLFLQ